MSDKRIRAVPEDRIRRLEQYAECSDGLSIEEVMQQLWTGMGREIAAKLAEFNKCRVVQTKRGKAIHAYIEVIVPSVADEPETPQAV